MYQLGSKINNEYIVEGVFEGGMSEVYLCIHEPSELPYALKTLQQKYYDGTPNLPEILTAEAEIWSSIGRHPNIVRCFGSESIDGRLFLLLQRISGFGRFAADFGRIVSFEEIDLANFKPVATAISFIPKPIEHGAPDLRTYLKNTGNLRLPQSLQVVMDICRGLSFARVKFPNLVHRDIKPENIFLKSDGFAALSDFGLASVKDILDPSAGSPLYMSPEQWTRTTVDHRTDIYQLGCLLFELIVGTPPFSATTLAQLKDLHIHAPIPRLNVSEELQIVVNNCMAKKPSERFSDVDVLSQQLQTIWNELYDTPHPEPAESQPFEIQDYINRANLFNQTGDYAAALQDLEDASRIQPDSWRLYFTRGTTYLHMGRYDEAKHDLQKALKLQSGEPVIHNTLGIVFSHLKNYEAALIEMRTALQLAPNHLEYLRNIEKLFLDHKKYEDLVQFSTELINEQFDPNLLILRSKGYLRLGKTTESLQDLNAAIEANTSNVEAYWLRGQIYEGNDDYQTAEENYNEGISRNSSFPDIYKRRMDLMEKLGRHADVIRDASKCLELGFITAEIYYKRGFAYGSSGEHLAAWNDFTDAIQLTQTSHILSYRLARALAASKIGRFADGIEDCNQILRVAPDFAAAYARRATLHAELNNIEQALMDFNSALTLDPHNVECLLNRGVFLEKIKDFEGANRDYTRVIELNIKDVAKAHIYRGDTFQELQRWDDARNDYETAIKMQPENDTPYYNLGIMYYNLGKHQEASIAFEQALQRGNTKAKDLLERIHAENSPGNRAYYAFYNTESFDDMKKAVWEYPLLRSDFYLIQVRQHIDSERRIAERAYLEIRWKWINQIFGGVPSND